MSVPDHFTAVVRNARALATRGDLRGAQAMLDRALEPAITMLGPDHPEVLATTRLLASLHRELGELSDARRLLEEGLAAGQFTLGEDSAALLPLSYDLAMLADELGNRHEARRNFNVLLRHGPAVLGPDHEYVRAARRYLGVETASAADRSGETPAPTAPVPLQPSAPAASAPPTPSTPPAPPGPSAPPAPPGPLPPSPPRSSPVWSPRDSDEHRHSRAPMLALVLIAAMALVGGGVAAFLVFHAPDRGPGPDTRPSSTADAGSLQPPGDLTLRDGGSSITLTWTDPTKGTVPFVVAGGRADNAPNPLGSVESGKTTYTLNGISSTADYCFLVAAVYSPQHTVPSALTCTRRSQSPSPKR
ncbi:MAG: Fibronectin, type domain protein [Dactylosporangium sp.]|nr:Fibronectin, type domain protein [Dactylosporangium sp.]